MAVAAALIRMAMAATIPSGVVGTAAAQSGEQIAVGAGPGGLATACVSCHGADGMGDAAAGFPRLAGLDAHYLAKQLDDYVSGTRQSEIMQPVAKALNRQQRTEVAQYYTQMPAALRATQTMRDVDPAALQRGGILWAQGSAEQSVQGCVNCHGGGARAGQAQMYPDVAGQPATYIAQELDRWKRGERRNDIAQVMAEIARRLSNADVQAVAAYLSRLPPS
jgi:cytochrome c553